jgi:ribulose-5-phosphate 4-epimerase/fuculose-1-phosphate aldolase
MSRHLPSLDFYLYAGWYRTRRDVACNVSTPPNHRICVDGASMGLRARPSKPHETSCHLPESDRYLYVGRYRARRDVACNVSTTPPLRVHGRCINRIMCAIRQIRAASRHLPSLDFYLYVGWYRTRRDVACNVSTPPNHCVCMDGASIVLCARSAKSVRHRVIYHHRIFIYTPVGIAPVETLHATSLHHQTIAYA